MTQFRVNFHDFNSYFECILSPVVYDTTHIHNNIHDQLNAQTLCCVLKIKNSSFDIQVHLTTARKNNNDNNEDSKVNMNL